MKQVLIVGCPGAGKSTLAKELAEATRLPVVHLDRHYWQPGWQRPDSASWQKTVEKLAAQSEWIMDGNYSGTLEQQIGICGHAYPSRLHNIVMPVASYSTNGIRFGPKSR